MSDGGFTTELHEIPKEHHLALELIHDRLQDDLRKLGQMQQDMQRVERVINKRYSDTVTRLMRSLGVEVEDGSLITGDVEKHTIEIKGTRREVSSE